ncbi:MAG: vitamin K epoxide reductase family protein [Nostocoides sp.]
MSQRLSVQRPRWLAPVSLTLALIGLIAAGYLSYEHATENASLYCPTGGPSSSCLTVTTSTWSTVLGIPVAYLGLVFFLAMTILCLPRIWRLPDPRLDTARLVALGVGLLTALYLIWAELFQIHAICTWCTVVHVATFLLLAVVAVGQILSVRTLSS